MFFNIGVPVWSNRDCQTEPFKGISWPSRPEVEILNHYRTSESPLSTVLVIGGLMERKVF